MSKSNRQIIKYTARTGDNEHDFEIVILFQDDGWVLKKGLSVLASGMLSAQEAMLQASHCPDVGTVNRWEPTHIIFTEGEYIIHARKDYDTDILQDSPRRSHWYGTVSRHGETLTWSPLWASTATEAIAKGRLWLSEYCRKAKGR